MALSGAFMAATKAFSHRDTGAGLLGVIRVVAEVSGVADSFGAFECVPPVKTAAKLLRMVVAVSAVVGEQRQGITAGSFIHRPMVGPLQPLSPPPPLARRPP